MLMRLLSPVLRPGARAALERTHWLGEWVRAHRSLLVRAAMDEGLMAEEALDAVQEAFVTCLSRKEWSQPRASVEDAGRLLSTLVRNHARNARRKHHRADVPLDDLPGEREPADAAPSVDSTLLEAEQHIALTGCLLSLKETQRAIVVARFLDGSSGSEVAEQLGMSPGHVAVILHRANRSLRSCLLTSAKRFGTQVAARRTP